MVEIVQVSADEAALHLGVAVDFPVTAFVGIENGEVIGAGGLAWSMNRCWLWLQPTKWPVQHPVYVVRMARRMLQKAVQFGDEVVYAMRDDEPTSVRLLEFLGFKLIGLEDLGLGPEEIWEWRNG